MEIKKILERKDGSRILVVPRNSSYKRGEYVAIVSLSELSEHQLLSKNSQKEAQRANEETKIL